MEITKTRVAAYVGAGVVAGAGFTALKSTSPRALALGAATGLVAGVVQSFVHEKTGISELGWGSAIVAGAASGALLLRHSVGSGLTPLRAGMLGAGIGAAAGFVGPALAGTALALLAPDAPAAAA